MGQSWFSIIISVNCAVHVFILFYIFSIADLFLLKINMYGFLDWVSSFYKVKYCADGIDSVNYFHEKKNKLFFPTDRPKFFSKSYLKHKYFFLGLIVLILFILVLVLMILNMILPWYRIWWGCPN